MVMSTCCCSDFLCCSCCCPKTRTGVVASQQKSADADIFRLPTRFVLPNPMMKWGVDVVEILPTEKNSLGLIIPPFVAQYSCKFDVVVDSSFFGH